MVLWLRRQLPGRLGLVAVVVVSCVLSEMVALIVYRFTGTGYNDPVALLLPVLTPLLVTPIMFGILFNTIDQLNAEVKRRSEAEQELRRMAGIDYLTGLANRRAVMQHLTDGLAADRVCALAMIDIDHFKQINDQFGHAVGDHVITAVARVLDEVVADRGVGGRFGGEEYAIVLDGGPGDHEPFPALLADLAARVRTVVPGITVTLSAGATLVQPGDTADHLLIRADRLLYVAKQSGRDQVVLDQPWPSGRLSAGAPSA